MKPFPFLPMTREEMARKGWGELDVLIVTGDAYVDHPSFGAAVIGRVLESRGYRVGIAAQPDWCGSDDFTRMGRPRLCVMITAGNVDSMVANYTANRKPRRNDDYSPGSAAGSSGLAGRRPDRASIVYSTRVKGIFRGLPVILGGVEASLRRLAHYDYWDDAVRRSVLVDAKADMLIYGMAEQAVIMVLDRLKAGVGDSAGIRTIRDVPGTVFMVSRDELPAQPVLLPSYEEVSTDPAAFNRAFVLAVGHMNPVLGKTLAQAYGDRVLLQLPPARPLTTAEMDQVYALPYVRKWHPSYDVSGGIRGFETVRWSVTAVRGCSGDCSFCGITMHQGRILQSRSEQSVISEVRAFTRDPDFRGTVSDVGGPTANLYAAECRRWAQSGACGTKQCLMPGKCPSLELGNARLLSLYRALRRLPGVKHVFIGSGIRYDLLLQPESGEYFRELCMHHVSGQMKVAPEHTEDKVLALMNKPPHARYREFVRAFEDINSGLKQRIYLANYFISAHPGSGLKEAYSSARELLSCGMRPEQVQDFIPLPMTLSASLYHTGVHPFTGEQVESVKVVSEREMQRALVQSQNERSRPYIAKALRLLGRENDRKLFYSAGGSGKHPSASSVERSARKSIRQKGRGRP